MALRVTSGMTLHGFDRLRVRLRLAQEALAREELPLAVEETVKEAARTARSYIGQERPEWKPLAARTIAEKRPLGFVGRLSATDPLLRTGKMRGSIYGYGFRLTGVVASNEPVALWQDQGTEDGHVPARAFLKPALLASLAFARRAMAMAWFKAWR